MNVKRGCGVLTVAGVLAVVRRHVPCARASSIPAGRALRLHPIDGAVASVTGGWASEMRTARSEGAGGRGAEVVVVAPSYMAPTGL